jgi:hypothetical protein
MYSQYNKSSLSFGGGTTATISTIDVSSGNSENLMINTGSNSDPGGTVGTLTIQSGSHTGGGTGGTIHIVSPVEVAIATQTVNIDSDVTLTATKTLTTPNATITNGTVTTLNSTTLTSNTATINSTATITGTLTNNTRTGTSVVLQGSSSVAIRTTNLSSNTGAVSLLTGNGSSSAISGALTIGSGTSASGSSGTVTIRSGNSSSGGTTGNINIQPGTTSGSRGIINIPETIHTLQPMYLMLGGASNQEINHDVFSMLGEYWKTTPEIDVGPPGQKITNSGGRLTVNVQGRYVARAVIWFGTLTISTGKNKEISFHLNGTGSANRLGGVLKKEEPVPISLVSTYVFDLVPGEFIDVLAYQNSGSQAKMLTHSILTGFFCLEKIG